MVPSGRTFDDEAEGETRKRATALRKALASVTPSDEFDPLSETPSWSQFYRDQEIKETIRQDCIRLFPDIPWYQDQPQQQILSDILFVWSKTNSLVGYNQGMHEIAGIVVWVNLHNEPCEFPYEDSYSIFDSLMKYAKSFYGTDQDGVSLVLNRTNRIQSELLPILDRSLTQALKSLGIEMQLYAIKWLRLLFSREFGFEEGLELWDKLFAADQTLDLADFICCAMMMRVRDHVIGQDYNAALTTLMRFPSPKTVSSSFVQDALHLRNYFTPIGGDEIIERYKDGIVGGDTTLDLRLSQAPSSAFNELLHRTEKLGINGYVRSAVKEVRRNVAPIINETRHVLRNTPIESASSAGYTTSPVNDSLHRDHELVSLITLITSGIRAGDSSDTIISRLEDIKAVLQGRKTLAQLDLVNKSLRTESARSDRVPELNTDRPSSTRARSPIRIPPVKSRLPASSENHRTSSLGTHKNDIPLTKSPEKTELVIHRSERIGPATKTPVRKDDFAFLFGDETPSGLPSFEKHSNN